MPRSTNDAVRVHREGEVCTLTIARPDKLNALSRPVLRALRDAFVEADADLQLKCMIVRGAGERYFAAGGDLFDLADVRSEPEVIAMVTECRSALDAVRHCAIPVIAMLNGDAIGGGAELALACDFRILSDHARIGFVHGRIGISSAWGGGTDLVDLVGTSRALRMMVRAELVPAPTALEWGLADRVVPAAGAVDALAGFLEPILQQSAIVLRAAKAQIRAVRDGLSREERRAIEQRGLVESWSSDDHWNAVDRFLAGDRLNGRK